MARLQDPRNFSEEDLDRIGKIENDLPVEQIREMLERKVGALNGIFARKDPESYEIAYFCCLKVTAALLGQITLDDPNSQLNYLDVCNLAFDRLRAVRGEVLEELRSRK